MKNLIIFLLCILPFPAFAYAPSAETEDSQCWNYTYQIHLLDIESKKRIRHPVSFCVAKVFTDQFGKPRTRTHAQARRLADRLASKVDHYTYDKLAVTTRAAMLERRNEAQKRIIARRFMGLPDEPPPEALPEPESIPIVRNRFTK